MDESYYVIQTYLRGINLMGYALLKGVPTSLWLIDSCLLNDTLSTAQNRMAELLQMLNSEEHGLFSHSIQ